MKESFKQYLTSIRLSEALTRRVEEFYGFCATVCPEEIERLFISDYIDNEGARVFESVWFFSANYAMEAKAFASAENYDMALIDDPIKYLNLDSKEFDFKKATDKSRMQFRARIGETIASSLKASQENCDYLWDLITKFFVPRTGKE